MNVVGLFREADSSVTGCEYRRRCDLQTRVWQFVETGTFDVGIESVVGLIVFVTAV
jgi:hypothetical protein